MSDSPRLLDSRSMQAESAISGDRCRVCGAPALFSNGTLPPFDEHQLHGLQAAAAPFQASGELLVCKNCSIAIRQPCLSKTELEYVYESASGGQYDYAFETNSAWVVARKRLLARWSRSDKPKILDVGCYEGRFLDGLPKEWLRFGIEPCEDARTAANQRGIELIAGTIEADLSPWHGVFDAVCLFDVFEHLEDPSSALDLLLPLLRPGGCLLLSTLDHQSWPARLLGRDHVYYATPQHITFGSRRFFRWYANQRGLRLPVFTRISHQDHGFLRLVHQTAVALFFRLREARRPFRWPLRIVHRLPGFRSLAHKERAPFLPALRDHFVVELAITSQH